MNVEIGAEAVLFPEKEYISGIFVAVYLPMSQIRKKCCAAKYFSNYCTVYIVPINHLNPMTGGPLFLSTFLYTNILD
jgi:hypothetical protein